MTMLRVLVTGLIAAALAGAQSRPPNPLLALRDKAEKSAAAWQALAGTLEARVTRMLPCDPKLKAAIDEVSRVSDVRMAALVEYLRTASARAGEDVAAARKLASDVAELDAQIAVEANDIGQVRAALAVQMSDLGEGAKRRASLVEPWRALQEMSKAPKLGADEGIGASKAGLGEALTEVVTAAQARQVALQAEQDAAVAEAARWSAYYAARLARTQTECQITRGAAPPPVKKNAGKKQ
jgi:hypothetical protein